MWFKISRPTLSDVVESVTTAVVTLTETQVLKRKRQSYFHTVISAPRSVVIQIYRISGHLNVTPIHCRVRRFGIGIFFLIARCLPVTYHPHYQKIALILERIEDFSRHRTFLPS
jgi:hypothetical protein